MRIRLRRSAARWRPAGSALALAFAASLWGAPGILAAPEGALPDLGAVPDINTKIRSVSLSEVVFDTFDGRYVRLSHVSRKQIRRLRDAIRPIYRPRYGGAKSLSWLQDEDLVLGYASRKGAFAYPIKVLNFKEIVNDTIDGLPVLISYCPLCGSGVVYSRKLNGQTLLFGNTSGLYESDMVMYDHQSGSFWFQVMGEAIVGEMTGKRLTPLPSATMSWGAWKRIYPHTRLLTGDARGGFSHRYVKDPFSRYPAMLNRGRFAFPVTKEKLDRRLRAGEVVVTAEIDSAIAAYPIRLIGDRAVNSRLAGRRIAFFSRSSIGSAFLSTVSGRELTFQFIKGKFKDKETGSTWNLAGLATEGPMKGLRLKPLPGRRAFWFSVVGGAPGLKLHLP